MYICVCNAITDREIRQAVELGATTMLELKRNLGVAGNCGKCIDCARDILRDELSNASSACAAFALGQGA
jgi:bacterioferritin-associated ferredoxin